MQGAKKSKNQNNLYLTCRLIKSVGLHVKLVIYPLTLGLTNLQFLSKLCSQLLNLYKT